VTEAQLFQVAEGEYDRFMGRYSRALAPAFADVAGVSAGRHVLDVGCGPGALTAELVRRVGADRVSAVDPSEPFVEACARRNPGVRVMQGPAERIPFADASFNAVLAQLVLHFVSEPAAAVEEMRRVLKPGGVIAACVWDFSGGMEMLRAFWVSALTLDPAAPDEMGNRRFGRDGEIARLFESAELSSVVSGALEVEAAYEDFDDLWAGFLGGVGPAGVYCASLNEAARNALREELRSRLGSPSGRFSLPARAWYALGRS
jgi:SAM-dependent methyltransferase